jgi:hypothetical protein
MTKETHTMTRIFTCALGAFVLAAGIASSQTPAPTTTGGQTGTRTTGTRQSSTRNQKSTTARSTTYTGCLQGTSAEGYSISVLPSGAGQRNATAGTAGAQTYMVMPGSGVTTDLSTMTNKRVQIVGTLAPESGAMGSSTGAMGNSGANAGTTSTSGVGTSGAGRTAAGGGNTNAGGNTNPGANANPAGNTNAGGNTPAGGYGNSGANTTAQSAAPGNMANMGAGGHRMVTITSVRVVPGSCTQ